MAKREHCTVLDSMTLSAQSAIITMPCEIRIFEVRSIRSFGLTKRTLLEVLVAQRILHLLYPFPSFVPLLPLALGKLALQRQSSAFHCAETGDPLDCFFDAHNAILADKLLGCTNGVLQLLHLLEILIAYGSGLCQLHQRAYGLGVYGREAIDDTCSIEDDDRTELLAEAGIDAELVVVDLGV
jgi:hypothetical protein